MAGENPELRRLIEQAHINAALAQPIYEPRTRLL